MIRAHPIGVKPTGNALLKESYSREKTMGRLGLLNDELLAVVVQELPQLDLLALSHTCKALYAFCWYDELWKMHVYENSKHQLPDKWHGSWRKTALKISEEADIDAEDKVFSDFLFRPFQLSQFDYEKNIFKNLHRHAIKSYMESELTAQDFMEHAYKSPFIVKLDKPIAEWTMDHLVHKFGNEVFRQEYMDWPLKLYSEYMKRNIDETPLYLFDCHSAAHKALTFDLPLQNVFGKDYFTLLGEDRPDHQWLIVGPARSGSTFHKDPNGTSAWNSIVSGRKYWIMFPPNMPPPGVWTNDDQSEVTAPVSLAEWFQSGFYAEALTLRGFCHAITGPGECVYVPSGWWHAVVNLEDCIAMTGNFVARPNLKSVCLFLETKHDQISGFKRPQELYSMFMIRLHEQHPEVFDGDAIADHIPKRKRTWAETAAIEESNPFTFSFSV